MNRHTGRRSRMGDLSRVEHILILFEIVWDSFERLRVMEIKQ
jgi:hypothetical protein